MSNIQIVEDDKYYNVTFDYNLPMVEDMKALAEKRGCFWDRSGKRWRVVKFRRPDLEAFKKKFGYQEEEVVQEAERFAAIDPLPELAQDIPLLLKPFEYQKRGIAYCLDRLRVLIGDQPGLGKTLQACATVFAKDAFPCLVICPNTLKENWKREWMKVTGLRAMILADSIKTSWPTYYKVGMANIFIVNYESLEKYFVEGYDKPPAGEEHEAGKLKYIQFRENIKLFKAVIVDESHRCKNPSTRTAKLVAGITAGKDIRLLLTGTAVVNSPKDLYSQLCILGRQTFFGKTQAEFVRRYCEVGPKRKPGNLKELNYYLNKYCWYRREKHEVLKDLPPKVRQVMWCDLTNQREYDKAENDFIAYLQEIKRCTPEEQTRKLRGGFMVKMGILKNISALGKLETVREYVEEITGSGQKVILFCNLIEMCHKIASMWPERCLIINGEVPVDQRQGIVDKFQEDPFFDIIVCNHRAGGVGITLTAASEVGMVEEDWTFAINEQCEDRAHRVGQRSKDELESIRCTYFLGKDTIDDYIHHEIVMVKKDIADAVHGSTEMVMVEHVNKLLDLFAKKRQVKKEEY